VLPSPTEQNTDFTQFFKDEQLPANVIFDEWGIGSVPTLYEIPDFKYHPLEIMSTVEEIENWPWPDLGEEYRYKFRKQMSYSGKIAVSWWHRPIYWIRRYHGIIL
jgi:uroporphyrinogen decarboxylase